MVVMGPVPWLEGLADCGIDDLAGVAWTKARPGERCLGPIPEVGRARCRGPVAVGPGHQVQDGLRSERLSQPHAVVCGGLHGLSTLCMRTGVGDDTRERPESCTVNASAGSMI